MENPTIPNKKYFVGFKKKTRVVPSREAMAIRMTRHKKNRGNHQRSRSDFSCIQNAMPKPRKAAVSGRFLKYAKILISEESHRMIANSKKRDIKLSNRRSRSFFLNVRVRFMDSGIRTISCIGHSFPETEHFFPKSDDAINMASVVISGKICGLVPKGTMSDLPSEMFRSFYKQSRDTRL